VGLDWLVETVAAVDAEERTKFTDAVNARISPIAAPQAG
jgi:hypothetical protein